MEPSTIARGDGDGNDSESSDWSSSSDGEEEREGGGGGRVGVMKPSHHTSLIAEWEWRTMADSSDTRCVWVGGVYIIHIWECIVT